jgi:hypothetical protein
MFDSKELNELKVKNHNLQSEINALRAIIDGNYPHAVSWLATKVDRQRIVLDSLQKKGKGHTKEEREQVTV